MFGETVFIASSAANIEVAKLVKTQMATLGYQNITIWNEGVFGLTEVVFERLLKVAAAFDFAIMIWAADDITVSKGGSLVSPRDNVIFEGGLFMGAIGPDRVFIFCDRAKDVKIPSDFRGVILALYDGEGARSGQVSAVQEACNQVVTEIQKPRYQDYVGKWKSKYLATPEAVHREI